MIVATMLLGMLKSARSVIGLSMLSARMLAFAVMSAALRPSATRRTVVNVELSSKQSMEMQSSVMSMVLVSTASLK